MRSRGQGQNHNTEKSIGKLRQHAVHFLKLLTGLRVHGASHFDIDTLRRVRQAKLIRLLDNVDAGF